VSRPCYPVDKVIRDLFLFFIGYPRPLFRRLTRLVKKKLKKKYFLSSFFALLPVMEAISTTNEPWCSPQHKSIRNILPDSPEDIERFAMHSDDLQPTSDLHSSTIQGPNSRLVVVGSYEKRVILGRGGASTVKIGRRNRQISRAHVAIEFNTESQHFQLTVLGLNGANVDHVGYSQNAIIVLEDHSFIDILGDHIEFRIPPRPMEEKVIGKESLQDQELKSDELCEKPDDTPIKPPKEEENASANILPLEDTSVVKVAKEKQVEKIMNEDREQIDTFEKEMKDENNEEKSKEQKENDSSEAEEQDYSEVIIDALGKIK
jgi:hypothetical protein